MKLPFIQCCQGGHNTPHNHVSVRHISHIVCITPILTIITPHTVFIIPTLDVCKYQHYATQQSQACKYQHNRPHIGVCITAIPGLQCWHYSTPAASSGCALCYVTCCSVHYARGSLNLVVCIMQFTCCSVHQAMGSFHAVLCIMWQPAYQVLCVVYIHYPVVQFTLSVVHCIVQCKEYS